MPSSRPRCTQLNPQPHTTKTAAASPRKGTMTPRRVTMRTRNDARGPKGWAVNRFVAWGEAGAAVIGDSGRFCADRVTTGLSAALAAVASAASLGVALEVEGAAGSGAPQRLPPYYVRKGLVGDPKTLKSTHSNNLAARALPRPYDDRTERRPTRAIREV